MKKLLFITMIGLFFSCGNESEEKIQSLKKEIRVNIRENQRYIDKKIDIIDKRGKAKKFIIDFEAIVGEEEALNDSHYIKRKNYIKKLDSLTEVYDNNIKLNEKEIDSLEKEKQKLVNSLD